jgi:protein-disulfide isomerase
MTENESKGPTSSGSGSPSRFDPLALATLAGVVVMMALSLWNVWNLGRLGDRVARLEAGMGARSRPPGPDPNKVHDVNTAGAQAKGPDNAPVTIVEFSEFQCPFCARVVPTLKQIEDTYQGKVRIVWKHLPLDIHKDAVNAALAAEAAGRQGKFWELHDVLFENQKRLEPADLRQYAKDLQLDLVRFEADLRNADDKKKVEADAAEADKLGVTGTPGIFINGRFVMGAQPFEVFAKIIDEELAKLNIPVPPRPASN